MTILEIVNGEFIACLKANWSNRARVDQRRRRLQQLVTMVGAVAEAAEGRGGAAVWGSSVSAWVRVLREEAQRGQDVLDAASVVAGSSCRGFLSNLKALLVGSAEVDRLNEAVDELEHFARPGGDLDRFVKMLRLDAAGMELGAPPVAVATYIREPSASTAGSAAAAAGISVSGVKRKRASSSQVNGGSTSPDQRHSRRRRRIGKATKREAAPVVDSV